MAARARSLPQTLATRAVPISPPAQQPVRGRWTAILLAGQRPGIDPLAAHCGQTYKALVEVDGEPMLTRVLRTLLSHPQIRRVIVLAQEPDLLLASAFADGRDDDRVATFTSGSGIARSIEALARADDAWPYLVTTADHPLLDYGMLDQFIGAAGDADIAVGMVGRRTVLSRYPETKRTWLRFSDDGYSGANLFALSGPRALAALALWAGAESDRKRAFRLFLHFGLPLALRAITRTIDLAGALARAGEKLGLTAAPVLLSNADAAIDVDKPHDLLLAERILRGRAHDADATRSGRATG